LFLLGYGKDFARFSDQHGEIIAIIDICDVEIVLSTLIGRAQFFCTEQRAYGLSRFQIEAVVTDQAEDLSIAIDSIVTKHFLGDYITLS